MGSIVRYSGTATGCGVTPQEIDLTHRQYPDGSWVVSGPPVMGKVARVKVVKTAGPGTTVTALDMIQGSGGDVVVGWTSEALPMDVPVGPFPLYYRVDTSADLLAEVTIDDPADTTSIIIIAEIEVN